MYVSINPTMTLAQRYPRYNKFLIRGIFALVDSLVIGIKSLTVSGAISLEELDEEEAAGQKAGTTEPGTTADNRIETAQPETVVAEPAGAASEEPSDMAEQVTTQDEAAEEATASLSSIAIVIAMMFSLALFLTIFIVLPAVIANWLNPYIHNTVVYNLIEGAIRIAIFVGYLAVVSLMPDIRRVFQYHGAEHKVVHAYEAGLPLTPENASKFSTAHVRCGTAFIVIVMIISILVFSLMGRPALWIRVLERLAVIPFVAAFSYEIIKIAGRRENDLAVRIIMAPGLWLQRLTTREPDEGQLEVAIESLNAALGKT